MWVTYGAAHMHFWNEVEFCLQIPLSKTKQGTNNPIHVLQNVCPLLVAEPKKYLFCLKICGRYKITQISCVIHCLGIELQIVYSMSENKKAALVTFLS